MKKEKKEYALKDFMRPYKGLYNASVSCAIVGVLFSILPYFAIIRMINGLFSSVKDFSFYVFWCGISGLAWFFRHVFHGFSTSFSHKATFNVLASIQKALTGKLARLPMGDVQAMSSGTIKSIIVEKVNSIETTLAHILPEMTANTFVPIVIIVYLCTVDWRMGLISIITIPVGFLCAMGMMIGYEKKFNVYIKANRHMNDTAVEYINGIEVIKAFNQSATSYRKYSEAAVEASNSAVRWMKDSQFFFCLAFAIIPATLVTVLPFGCHFYMAGSLSLESFIVCIILSLGITPPIITAFSYFDDFEKFPVIMAEVNTILNKEDLSRPSEDERKNIKDFDISFKSVDFSYGKTKVIDNLNLKIDKGSVTAFVGPSGGGKSTLAKLIASQWDVDKGTISIGGVSIKDIPLEQLNEIVAFVSQDNFLFDESVRENIRMGNKNASDADVEAAAKSSGCHEFIMNLENGYETRAGDAGGHLSGGEKQRIAIARAMLKNAPIVILDEATAYTDPENEAVIQKAVGKLVQGKTLIVIAHRLSTITDSDSIVVIKDGKIEAQGTHNELLNTCNLYASMWESHISVKDSL